MYTLVYIYGPTTTPLLDDSKNAVEKRSGNWYPPAPLFSRLEHAATTSDRKEKTRTNDEHPQKRGKYLWHHAAF